MQRQIRTINSWHWQIKTEWYKSDKKNIFLLADSVLRTVFADDEGHWPVRSWWRWWWACCCQCRPARCASVWACTGSWRAPGPGSARCSPASEVGAAPQIRRGCHSVGEAGTGLGCTAGPSLLGGWWPLGYPARKHKRDGKVWKLQLKLKLEHTVRVGRAAWRAAESSWDGGSSRGGGGGVVLRSVWVRGETAIIARLSSH